MPASSAPGEDHNKPNIDVEIYSRPAGYESARKEGQRRHERQARLIQQKRQEDSGQHYSDKAQRYIRRGHSLLYSRSSDGQPTYARTSTATSCSSQPDCGSGRELGLTARQQPPSQHIPQPPATERTSPSTARPSKTARRGTQATLRASTPLAQLPLGKTDWPLDKTWGTVR